MSTKTTTSSNRRRSSAAKPVLSATLGTIPAIDGVRELQTLHQRFAVIPTVALTETLGHLEQIEALVVTQELSVLDLVQNQAAHLATLTGLSAREVTQFQPTPVAEALHPMRNLLVAIAGLGAHTITVNSAATSPETVYAHSVRLPRRSPHIRRPLAHDEIVLCRVAAHLAARRRPTDHAAAIYCLAEAGLVPGETTQFRIVDVDDPELPRLLEAAGNAHIASRLIELDQFTGHTLGRRLEHARRANHHQEDPVTYKPQKHAPGSPSATASAQRILDRFLKEVGIPTGDITATSITQWRVRTVFDTEGIDAALAVSGRRTVSQMLRALGHLPGAISVTPDDADIAFADL